MSIEYFVKVLIDLFLSGASILMLLIMRQILHKESFTQKKLIMLFTSILIMIILVMIWNDYVFVIYRYYFPATPAELINNANQS